MKHLIAFFLVLTCTLCFAPGADAQKQVVPGSTVDFSMPDSMNDIHGTDTIIKLRINGEGPWSILIKTSGLDTATATYAVYGSDDGTYTRFGVYSTGDTLATDSVIIISQPTNYFTCNYIGLKITKGTVTAGTIRASMTMKKPD
jgi:hypothetical protein